MSDGCAICCMVCSKVQYSTYNTPKSAGVPLYRNYPSQLCPVVRVVLRANARYRTPKCNVDGSNATYDNPIDEHGDGKRSRSRGGMLAPVDKKRKSTIPRELLTVSP